MFYNPLEGAPPSFLPPPSHAYNSVHLLLRRYCGKSAIADIEQWSGAVDPPSSFPVVFLPRSLPFHYSIYNISHFACKIFVHKFIGSRERTTWREGRERRRRRRGLGNGAREREEGDAAAPPFLFIAEYGSGFAHLLLLLLRRLLNPPLQREWEIMRST